MVFFGGGGGRPVGYSVEAVVVTRRYVPEGGHGDDGVPEGGRNGGEIGVGDVLLGVEHDGGEDDDGHGQREDEEAQLAGAALERVAEDAQTLRVAREFEDAEDAEDAQRHERPCRNDKPTVKQKKNRFIRSLVGG